MAQRKLVVSDITVGYDGLFDFAELFKMIDDWFYKNRYEKVEVRHIERVKEKGKFVDYEIMPRRKISDYADYEIYVRVTVNNMTDATIKKGGKEMKLNKGNVTVTISAYLKTDVRHQWEATPFRFFFRALFDKFVHKQYTDRYENEILKDVQEFHTELKSYLNLNRYVNPS